MSKKDLLGMSSKAFYCVCAFLVIGIIIGSIFDFQISVALSNKTDLGDFIQKYGNILSHCLYPAAGICIFKGLRKKGKKFNTLAWGILILSIFWTFYSFLDTSGKHLRAVYGYDPGAGSVLPLVFTFLTWIAVAVFAAWIAYRIIDDENSDLLIAIGAVILISGMFSEYINAWLKVVGCRPRFRYLITLDEPISEFRNWWQMTPYIKDESSFRSWPSGHMTKATIMFTLPMLASVLKNKKAHTKYWLFGFAVIWIVIIGYNRIHMNAHFLTDVCFGVLITYCVYAFVYKCVFSVFSGKAREEKRRKK